MGIFSASTATNILNNYITSLIQSLVQNTQNCSSSIGNTQDITIVDIKGDIDINHIDWSQFVSINSECVQASMIDTTTTNQISELITQTATQIIQALDIKIGDKASVDNITNLITQLANQVQNQTTQNCLNSLFQNQYIKIKHGTGNVVITFVKWQQTVNDLIACVQSSNDVTNITQALQQQFQQQASITEKGILDFLGDFWFLIIIAIVMIGFLMYKGAQTMTNPNFVIPMTTIFFSYFVLSYFWNGWPYYKITDTESKSFVFVIMVCMFSLFFFLTMRTLLQRQKELQQQQAQGGKGMFSKMGDFFKGVFGKKPVSSSQQSVSNGTEMKEITHHLK